MGNSKHPLDRWFNKKKNKALRKKRDRERLNAARHHAANGHNLSDKKPELVEPIVTGEGLEVLRRVLLRLRWDNQGGFPSLRHDLTFGESGTIGLPQATPKEIEVLMGLAGIVPDRIESLGSCRTCKWSDNGNERGYSVPCVSCKRPRMTLWEPK